MNFKHLNLKKKQINRCLNHLLLLYNIINKAIIIIVFFIQFKELKVMKIIWNDGLNKCQNHLSCIISKGASELLSGKGDRITEITTTIS